MAQSPKILIYLDPGHIYKYNVGAYKQYYEGTEMYNFSLLLKDEIEKYDGMKALISRTDVNDCPSLAQRAQDAKTKGAYLLLSLHTNGADAESARYVAIYSSVAMATKTDPLSRVMLDAVTEVLAADIPGVKANGVNHLKNTNGSDYYGILRCATGGSVQQALIIEHGFHSNYATSKWWYNKNNQIKMAKAEAKALANFYGCILMDAPEVVVPDEPLPIEPPLVGKSYIVIRNDSWWKIAKEQLGDGNRYKELAAFNGMSSDTAIHPGDTIKIPGTITNDVDRNYIVVANDSWWGIAAKKLGNGELYDELAAFNGKTIKTVLHPGDIIKLLVNDKTETVPDSKFKSYTVKNGDSLWKIAQTQLGDGLRYPEVAKASGISTSFTILPGMVLKVPVK